MPDTAPEAVPSDAPRSLPEGPGAPSFQAAPLEALFAPGAQGGLRAVAPPPLLRPVDGARIGHIALTDNPHIRKAWARESRTNRSKRQMAQRFEFGNCLALVDDVSFRKTYTAIGPRWFLSGAGGHRLWTKYWRVQRERNGGKQPTERFATDFETIAAGAPTLPLADADREPGLVTLPFVLDARNLKNYYHFMAETFCNLALLRDLPDFRGEIFIHCPGTEPAGFIGRFAEAVFPELAPRIRYPGPGIGYPRALTAFTPNYYLWQAPRGEAQALWDAGAQLDASEHWSTAYPSGPARRTLAMNSYSRALRLLREAALEAAATTDTSHLPTRFWFSRRPGGPRDRTVPHEDEIIAGLKERGYGVVYFEELTPLEQVAIMNRAERVVSYHGAGFTNLIYAGQGTEVIELGTLQSGALRWSDFVSLAHVSGCGYTLGICDSDVPVTAPRPNLRGRLQHTHISEAGIAALFAHIDKIG